MARDYLSRYPTTCGYGCSQTSAAQPGADPGLTNPARSCVLCCVPTKSAPAPVHAQPSHAVDQLNRRFRPGLMAFFLRSEEHTSELQSLMRISYAVFCLKKKKNTILSNHHTKHHKK